MGGAETGRSVKGLLQAELTPYRSNDGRAPACSEELYAPQSATFKFSKNATACRSGSWNSEETSPEHRLRDVSVLSPKRTDDPHE